MALSPAGPGATWTGCDRTCGPPPGVTEDDLLLLADAQTSGGLLVVGEVPGLSRDRAYHRGPGHRDPLKPRRSSQPAVVIESPVMPAARRAASRFFCGSIV